MARCVPVDFSLTGLGGSNEHAACERAFSRRRFVSLRSARALRARREIGRRGARSSSPARTRGRNTACYEETRAWEAYMRRRRYVMLENDTMTAFEAATTMAVEMGSDDDRKADLDEERRSIDRALIADAKQRSELDSDQLAMIRMG